MTTDPDQRLSDALDDLGATAPSLMPPVSRIEARVRRRRAAQKVGGGLASLALIGAVFAVAIRGGGGDGTTNEVASEVETAEILPSETEITAPATESFEAKATTAGSGPVSGETDTDEPVDIGDAAVQERPRLDESEGAEDTDEVATTSDPPEGEADEPTTTAAPATTEATIPTTTAAPATTEATIPTTTAAPATTEATIPTTTTALAPPSDTVPPSSAVVPSEAATLSGAGPDTSFERLNPTSTTVAPSDEDASLDSGLGQSPRVAESRTPFEPPEPGIDGSGESPADETPGSTSTPAATTTTTATGAGSETTNGAVTLSGLVIRRSGNCMPTIDDGDGGDGGNRPNPCLETPVTARIFVFEAVSLSEDLDGDGLPSGQQPVEATSSDSSGRYSVSIPPGRYSVFVADPDGEAPACNLSDSSVACPVSITGNTVYDPVIDAAVY